MKEKCILSLILCSRNDDYMGNSLWRLQTTLNFLAYNVHGLKREDDVEVIVADWGSEIPLREVLQLSRFSARITRFLEITPEVAKKEQKDSPFCEVRALNAAVRRSNGEYIGRIDQDTLVGKRFLKMFFEMYEETGKPSVSLNSAFIFSERRSIPYRFVVRCPSFENMNRFIRWFGRLLRVETARIYNLPFFYSYVGIMLMHGKLWKDCRGYDERLIYWGWMETDMALRLGKKYKLLDLGKSINFDFYHLDHLPYQAPGVSSRKMNQKITDNTFCPNSEDWGLVQYPLKMVPFEKGKEPT